MDFDLTEEQDMIRGQVRRFSENEIAPVAAELDEKEAIELPESLHMKSWSTGCQNSEHSGGYLETQPVENVFNVLFFGSRHTGREQVMAERTP